MSCSGVIESVLSFFSFPGGNNECQRKTGSVNAGSVNCNCCVLGIYQQVIMKRDELMLMKVTPIS